jgi:hypothetical protein
MENGEESEPQPVPGFTKLHPAYEIGALSAETKGYNYTALNYTFLRWKRKLCAHTH